MMNRETEQAWKLKQRLWAILDAGGYMSKIKSDRVLHALDRATTRFNRRQDKQIYQSFWTNDGRA